MQSKTAWQKTDRIVEESFQKVPSTYGIRPEEYVDMIEGRKRKRK